MISYACSPSPTHSPSYRPGLRAIVEANDRYHKTLQGGLKTPLPALSRTPSIPESLDTYIPAGDLFNDQDVSGFLLSHYHDTHIPEHEELLLRSTFQDDAKKFYLPYRDSLTDSITDFGDSLGRPLSILFPDALSVESIAFSDEQTTPLQTLSNSSSARTLAQMSIHTKRSITPSQFDYLSCQLSDLRQSHSFSSTTSTVAPSTPVPTLAYSSPTSKTSSLSSRGQSSRCPSSTQNNGPGLVTYHQTHLVNSDARCTVLHSALQRECYRSYMDKPLPNPIRQSRSASQEIYHMARPASPRCHPGVSQRSVSRPIPPLDFSIDTCTAYQTPRQAPPTPTLEQDRFKSHIDWSEDESQGLKTMLRSATKSFTDLRQAASRRRADSNRTPRPETNIDGHTSQQASRRPSPVPCVLRQSNRSSAARARLSRDTDSAVIGKPCIDTKISNHLALTPGLPCPKRTTSSKLKKSLSGKRTGNQCHIQPEKTHRNISSIPGPQQQVQASMSHSTGKMQSTNRTRPKKGVKKNARNRVPTFRKLWRWFRRLKVCG